MKLYEIGTIIIRSAPKGTTMTYTRYLSLEEERAAVALDLALGHDGDAVAQHVRLLHEVCRQQQRAVLLLRLKFNHGLKSGKPKTQNAPAFFFIFPM
jgi:hypothetical protein